jgi:hypothetical protein
MYVDMASLDCLLGILFIINSEFIDNSLCGQIMQKTALTPLATFLCAVYRHFRVQ